MKVVLDADVLIGALDGSDTHHSQARQLFSKWHKQEVERLISIVNLSEVLVAPAANAKSLRIAREAVSALGVTIHQPGELIGIDAAQLRGYYTISLTDAYCLATARHTKGFLVSFDHRIIRTAHSEGISICKDSLQ